MTYAFTFDATSCSGCKACQIACKDKNNLPVGVFWRRVFEVSGGEWKKEGDAWQNSVFAYNLSMACNHCVHPKCAGVCPTGAYDVREDGIVLLDSSRCVGCGYCNWACPYAVPQYNHELGSMSKCNFCFDLIDAGDPPACVSACPLRVLDIVNVDHHPELLSEEIPQGKVEPNLQVKLSASVPMKLWELPGAQHPYPLPVYSRTQPHMAITPHSGMLNQIPKVLSNTEEIKNRKQKSELSLVFFTLLAQMAVGAFWVSQWLYLPIWTQLRSNDFSRFVLGYNSMLIWESSPFPPLLSIIPSLLIGICLASALIISFAHLGRKRNAWRVFTNINKSSISKEILFSCLFGAGFLATILFPLTFFGIITDFLGLGLLVNMANIYRLRSIAAWNTWRTLAGFIVTALLLGFSASIPVLSFESNFTGISLSSVYLVSINIGMGLLLFAQVFLTLQFPGKTELLKRTAIENKIVGAGSKPTQGFSIFSNAVNSAARIGLVILLIVILLVSLFFPQLLSQQFYLLFFLLVFTEEVIGRIGFYKVLEERIL